MMKKYKGICIILAIMLTLLPNKIYAYDTEAAPSVNLDEWGDGPDIFYDFGIYRYRCEYEAMYGVNYKLSISAIDTNGKDVINNNGGINQYTLSGTWVGINVTEHNDATWQVQNVERIRIQKEYKCSYTGSCKEWNYSTSITTKDDCTGEFTPLPKATATPTPASNNKTTTKKATISKSRRTKSRPFEEKEFKNANRGNNNIKPLGAVQEEEYGTCKVATTCKEYYTDEFTVTKEYNEEYTCPEKEGYTVAQTVISYPEKDSSGYLKTCKDKIHVAVRNTAKRLINNTSNTVTYIDTNDAKEISTATANINVASTGCAPDTLESGKCWKDYEHRPNKVCMDVRTGLVYYDTKCSKDDYLDIPDIVSSGKKYWHYFSPLNAKSASQFYLQTAHNNTSTLDMSLCEDIMKRYDNYYNRIKPINSDTYIGDYGRRGQESSDYKTLASEKACKVSIRINFRIDQKFYNEKGRMKTLNGYKFYFRQVDITHPFNITPDENSLWYNWYNKNKNNPTFDKSYDEISYQADIKNPKTIRAYNDSFNNPYTSWEKISRDGLSSFIRKDNFVTVKKTGDIYKLGCGPENKDWSGCK